MFCFQMGFLTFLRRVFSLEKVCLMDSEYPFLIDFFKAILDLREDGAESGEGSHTPRPPHRAPPD